MDKSDLLYSQYFLSEWSTQLNSDDNTFDQEFANKINTSIKQLKGIRFIGNDIIESYVDLWHYDNSSP